jgi:shikimate dehydrogenase
VIDVTYLHGNFAQLKLGLIGTGIQASRTPAMHEREASEHGLLCKYRLIDLETLGLAADALPDLVEDAEQSGFSGLNITHPCKQSILPLLTDISEDAGTIGAVNTVVFSDGKRFGHNTDWLGFREGFLRGLRGVSLKRVVQLGAGGGGAATAYALMKMGAGHLELVDPDRHRCQALVDRYCAAFGPGRISVATDIEASLAGADGLVHASPTGMNSHPGLPLPRALLHSSLWVAEIVYFPLETELLRAARAAGCRTLDGSGMAVHQAIQAFRLFTGLEADPERMHQHFLALLPT